MRAQARGLPDPIRRRRVEHLDVNARDIVADPLLEDVDQEPSVPLRGNRAAGDDIAVLYVQRRVALRGPGHGAVLAGRQFDRRIVDVFLSIVAPDAEPEQAASTATEPNRIQHPSSKRGGG
jgi:hypothetical protein